MNCRHDHLMMTGFATDPEFGPNILFAELCDYWSTGPSGNLLRLTEVAAEGTDSRGHQ